MFDIIEAKVIISWAIALFIIGWKFLSKQTQEWLELQFKEKILRYKKPYYESKSLDHKESYVEIENNLNRKNFIIRIGSFATNDSNYNKLMKWAIEQEHIWDWHFFLKTDKNQSYAWADDFFEREGGVITKTKKNTTTQLSIIEKTTLLGKKNNFEQYNINVNFDDIVIMGLIVDDNFLEISELTKKLENLPIVIDKILIYEDNNIKQIKLYKDEIAKSIIQAINESYEHTKTLLIKKDTVESNDNLSNLINELDKAKK